MIVAKSCRNAARSEQSRNPHTEQTEA